MKRALRRRHGIAGSITVSCGPLSVSSTRGAGPREVDPRHPVLIPEGTGIERFAWRDARSEASGSDHTPRCSIGDSLGRRDHHGTWSAAESSGRQPVRGVKKVPRFAEIVTGSAWRAETDPVRLVGSGRIASLGRQAESDWETSENDGSAPFANDPRRRIQSAVQP